jgi:hypothetical protein
MTGLKTFSMYGAINSTNEENQDIVKLNIERYTNGFCRER